MRPLLLMAAAIGLVGCGGNTNQQAFNTFDFAGGNPDLAGTNIDPNADMTDTSNNGGADMTGSSGGACTSYTKSTIAAMRMAKTSGCFEIDNVVTVATSPQTASSKSIRIIAQDPAGGDYSGIVVTCYSTSAKHPCTVLPTAGAIIAGRSITVMGYYVNGGYESMSIDSVTDNGSGTPPAPASLVLTDVERGAMTTAKWFQKVTLTIAAADQLKMFDFFPPEFQPSSQSGTCTHVYGFGMIPKSASGAPGPACSGTTMQPAGMTAINNAEVLFGTDYYGGFTANSQCTCISSKTMKPYPGLLSAGSTLSGKVSAILFYDQFSGPGYQYLSPLTNADAPITGLSM